MGKPGRSGVNATGRRRKLTPEQEAELLRRHALYYENCPKVLAHQFGISRACVDHYVRRARAET